MREHGNEYKGGLYILGPFPHVFMYICVRSCTEMCIVPINPTYIYTTQRRKGTFVFIRLNMSLRKRKFCEHCQEYVSPRTYRQHLDLYYNKQKEEWQKNDSSDEESSPPTGENLYDASHMPVHVATMESWDDEGQEGNEQESAPGTNCK